MAKDSINDVRAFLAVAREKSFTKAAAHLGVSPSALSHAMRGLEDRLGVVLLRRTTRNVSPTEVGETFLKAVQPHFEQIDAEIKSLGEMRDSPAGKIQITSVDYATDTIFRPKLKDFILKYPDIKIEISNDYGFVDIVRSGFDAGVRLGEDISKDMVAVRIGADWRMAVVGSPDYFKRRSIPVTPQELTNHSCINLRLISYGGLYAWEFRKDEKALNVRVDGQLTFNSIPPVLNAALDGLGLAYVPESLARPYIDGGTLQEVLAEWCPYFQGYHLYYPSRRQTSPVLALLIDALRYRD